MFRHPNLKNIMGTFDDLTFQKKIDQSIRYYKVPSKKDKEGVLNFLLTQLPETETKPVVNRNVRRLYYTISSVAAVGLIIFTLYFFFAINTLTGVQSASNVYYLPDYSRVILTEGSQLKYSKLFYNRNVTLKGEAYFEVEKGDDFYVKTKNGGVLVLGTRFSVNNSNNQLSVHCYQGTVGVDYLKSKIKLSAGMEFVGSNSSISVDENVSIAYPKYAEFNFICQNKKITEIWPLIESYFGVKIIDQVYADKSFTGSINTGNVIEVIDIICTSMELRFKKDNEKQIVILPKENL